MKNNIVDGIPTAYHAAYYVNGSLCDITGKSRMTSVKVDMHVYMYSAF